MGLDYSVLLKTNRPLLCLWLECNLLTNVCAQFIRHLNIPYLSLYDKGYTSLGGTEDTHPNPQLKSGDSDGFRPAYELVADDEERLGRDK